MTEYHVEYRIEVEADSPREAAQKVAEILSSGGAERGVYHVRQHTASGAPWWEEIDLGKCATCDANVIDGAELGYGRDGDLCYECDRRLDGEIECPNCGEWKPVDQVIDRDFPNGPITMCSSCEHNARRSG